jgi:hypothetical protein
LATTGLGCGLSVASTKLMKPKRQKLLIWLLNIVCQTEIVLT